jgi:hypothetical protein
VHDPLWVKKQHSVFVKNELTVKFQEAFTNFTDFSQKFEESGVYQRILKLRESS